MSLSDISTVTVNGTPFAYRSHGEGNPLVFVHGSVADLTTFTRQVERFSATHRAITYSRRFHPPNLPPGPGDVYDTVQQADDMYAFLGAIGALGSVVIGSSFGAYIALVATIRHPGLVQGLVLCEPPMLPLLLYHPDGKPLYDAFAKHITAPSRQAFLEGRDEDALATFVDGVRGQPGNFRRMLPGIRAELMRFAPELKAEFLAEPSRYMHVLSLQELRSVAVPTLLIGGALSTPTFRSILDVLEWNLPDRHRILLPRAGHLAHLQNPVAFEAEVRLFLAENGLEENRE